MGNVKWRFTWNVKCIYHSMGVRVWNWVLTRIPWSCSMLWQLLDGSRQQTKHDTQTKKTRKNHLLSEQKLPHTHTQNSINALSILLFFIKTKRRIYCCCLWRGHSDMLDSSFIGSMMMCVSWKGIFDSTGSPQQKGLFRGFSIVILRSSCHLYT
jgi:hypothetical protein